MVALGPIDPDQQHDGSLLVSTFAPGLEEGGNLMEQCSTSARHPTSRLPPRLTGGGTVLTKGLRLHPLVPSGAHPPAGHSKPPASEAHCIAISSFVLGRRS